MEVFEAEGDNDDSYQLEVLSNKLIGKKYTGAICAKSDDVDFKEEMAKSRMTVKLIRLTADQENVLGLKSGSELTMTCKTTLSFPVNCKQ